MRPGSPSGSGKPEAARELVRTQAVRKLEQGQRITMRLRDDPVSHPRVQPTGDHGGQQVAGVRLGEALDDHPGNPRELVQGHAGGEDQREGIRFGAPGDKGQRLQGFPVDPLCVIDQTQERSFSRKIGQQAQGAETDEEPVGRCPGQATERHRDRLGLRNRKTVTAPDHPGAELMQGGVRQRQLGLHARNPEHREL